MHIFITPGRNPGEPPTVIEAESVASVETALREHVRRCGVSHESSFLLGGRKLEAATFWDALDIEPLAEGVGAPEGYVAVPAWMKAFRYVPPFVETVETYAKRMALSSAAKA